MSKQIGSIKLTKDFLNSALNVLGCVDKDSGQEHPMVFFKVNNGKLLLVRKNRHSEAFINCVSAETKCDDIVIPILYEDLAHIVKTAEKDINIKLYDDRMKISGDTYAFDIQRAQFVLDSVKTYDELVDDVAAFTIDNSLLKSVFLRIVSPNPKRSNSIFESVIIEGEDIYSIDHNFMSCHEGIDKTLDKPVPLFLFQVSQKLNDDCHVSFYPGERNIAISFNIGDLDHVVCSSSYLIGNWPLEQVKKIFQEVTGITTSFTVNTGDFCDALNRVIAIAGKEKSAIFVSVDDKFEKFQFKAEYSEKMSESELRIDGLADPEHTLKIEKFQVQPQILARALKRMDEQVDIAVTDDFFVVWDTDVCHVMAKFN